MKLARFFSITLLYYCYSCSKKSTTESFPYGESTDQALFTTLACVDSSSQNLLKLPDPAQTNPTTGIGESEFDSSLEEGVIKTSLTGSCQKQDPSDSLFECQWNLSSQGLGIGNAQNKPYIGADIKLPKDLMDLYAGTNLHIHISDTGVQLDHPELKNHLNFDASYNFCLNNKSPTPKSLQIKTDHGTKVAGIISATANNQWGTRGIAPQSQLSVDNAISCAPTAQAWITQLVQPLVDIWSGSFGTETEISHMSNTGDFDLINQSIIKEFNSKQENPTAYFKAAGNERSLNGNANRDPLGWNPLIAQIAAVNEKFKYAYYSNPGSNLLVSAFGAGESSSSPGICTTEWNSTTTCSFNGTSAATPQVAGVAALMKDAAQQSNKIKLSPVDIYYILAKTAVPVSEDRVTPIATLSNKTWINYSVNSAGYRHSVNYGFGVVNASKAIKLASSKNYQKLPPLEEYKKFVGSDCGTLTFKTNTSCAVKKIEVKNSFQVFAAVISVDAAPLYTDKNKESHPLGQIFGYLIHPDGTRSELMRPHSSLEGSNYTLDQYHKSYAVMGIEAKGVWGIELCARSSLNEESSDFNFNQALIKLYGWNNQSPLPPKNF
jgi:hypothetical protein